MPIVPDDDIWRALPSAFEPINKLRVETLVYACDGLELAVASIYHFCNLHRAEADRASSLEKRSLFAACWQVVDCLHAIRTILLTMLDHDPGPIQGKYLAKYEAAYRLRNRYDHLDQSVANLASRKGYNQPIFGSLAYFVSDLFEPLMNFQTFHRGTLVFIGSGSSTGNSAEFTGKGPGTDDPRLPLSNVTFSAFDDTIDIDDVIRDTTEVVDTIRLGHHEQFNAQFEPPYTVASPEVRGPVMGDLVGKMELIWPIQHRKSQTVS